jgi:hypothetical protein
MGGQPLYLIHFKKKWQIPEASFIWAKPLGRVDAATADSSSPEGMNVVMSFHQ